ncbi:MAG: hypothetical protein AAF614_01400 [Chloroflexota bacterium]
MDFVEERPGLVAAIAFVVGLIIGLTVLGWWLWPVEYVGAGIRDLGEADQALVLQTAASAYAFDRNGERVQQLLGGWTEGAATACRLTIDPNIDQSVKTNLEAMVSEVTGTACQGINAAPEVEDEGSSTQWATILSLFLLAVLLAGIWYVWNQRNRLAGDTSGSTTTYTEVPESAPVAAVGEPEVAAVPIARFRTSYGRGHDTYDDSFSIENAKGDFLGECGVGISESIGTDSPKNVTAIEVWLFDKNDIRTITKVIMSDHAFFDDALKAKLAPKGEPVLAREGETIVLETATLIINALISEMEYGTDGMLSPDSYFERFTIELSAWAKEGDFDEPDIQGRVDELMNY